MLKKLGLVALVSLIIGSGIGYVVGTSKSQLDVQAPVVTSGTHSTSPDAMVQELQSKGGSSRDEAFLEMMITHHQSAIEMSRVLLTSTKRPELQKLANDIITAQNGEIEMMQNWLKEWYGR